MMPMEHVDPRYRIPLPMPDPQLSEFNHHLAGVMVILVGISAILIYARPRQFGFLKYVWPMSLFLLGAYLVVYSDPPGWPTSYVSIAHTWDMPEARQHKIFALLLLMMGSVEAARAAGIAKGRMWGLAFPALALAGAVYLLFHKHGGSGAMHMEHGEHMEHGSPIVFYQHFTYFLLGLGIVGSRILLEMDKLRTRWGPYIWPSLTVLLGIALVFYRE
ncbi:MAG: hypothetical protein ABFD54_08260 [Armatimonadota bacterium]|nr:hypothetical protein [bacterium]